MKKALSILVVLILALGLVTATAENKVIRVAASANPHEILLNFVKDDLKELGFDLEVTWIDGYVLQNPATSAGEYEANFFQHRPYLNKYNESVGEAEQLVAVIPVHYEPFGIYPGTKKALEDPATKKRIEDTGSIIIANTPEQFAEQIKAELAVYKDVVVKQKLTLE